MIIGERGQVTIPQEYRNKFGLGPGVEVEFVVVNSKLCLVPQAAARRRAVESLFGKKKFGRSTNELMKFLRDK